MPETPSSPENPASPEPAPSTAETRSGGTPPGDAPTTPMPPADPPPKRLLRDRDDRVIGGVCGGIARYFGIDPLIVRIAAVALAFIGGSSVIAYIAALALVPEDDGTGRPAKERPSRVGTVVGAVLIVLAGLALVDGGLGVHPGWLFAPLVPLAIVGAVLAVAGRRLLRSRGEAPPTAGRVVGAGLVVLGIIIASTVAAVGAAWGTAAGGGTAIAVVVIALGVAMFVLSLRNRSARWLALPALVLAIPSGVVSAAGIDTHGGVGQRTYRPATIADLRTNGYRLGAGELEVDLRDMQWPQDASVSVRLKAGVGHVLLLVPEDTCVQAKTRVALGYVDVLGEDTGGADLNDERGTLLRHTTGRRLFVDADLGIGAVEVRHQPGGRHDHRAFGQDGQWISATLADAGCAGARA